MGENRVVSPGSLRSRPTTICVDPPADPRAARTMPEGTTNFPGKPSLCQRCARVLVWCAITLLLAAALYLTVVLIGLIPVNNDFQPTPDGIEIFLISSAVHADVVLPMVTDTIDWREHFPADCFRGNTRRATHVAIGWGDKGFFLETPTWSDLRASTTAYALFWPSRTCMHVTLTKPSFLRGAPRSVKISVAQYERLVAYVNKSFRHHPDGSKIHIADTAYGRNDAFFEARGTYHCFNTCNCWIGRAMQSAGIRTGWLTPLPKTMFLYLPE